MHTFYFFFFLLLFFSLPFALFDFSSLVPCSAMHLHASISPILGALFPFLPALAVLLDTQHFTATFSSYLSFFHFSSLLLLISYLMAMGLGRCMYILIGLGGRACLNGPLYMNERILTRTIRSDCTRVV